MNAVEYYEVTFEEFGDCVSLEVPPAEADEQIETWTRCLFEPEDLLEIRCFPSKQLAVQMAPRKYRWGETRYLHRFEPWRNAVVIASVDDLERMNAGVTTKWGESGSRQPERVGDVRLNIYCSANPRTARKSVSAYVPCARSLLVDMDCIDIEAAWQRLQTAHLPTPTLTVNSGHGVHAYWRLTEPVTDLAKWTTLQKRLIQALGSDPKIHDPARLMRLPGFMNINGTLAPCEVIDADPVRRYELADIEAHLPPAAEGGPTKPRKRSTTAAEAHLHVAADERLMRAMAYQQEVEPAVEGERNSRTFRLGCDLVEKLDLDEHQLLEVLKNYANRSADSIDDTEIEEIVQKSLQHVHKKGIERGIFLDLPLQPYQEPKGEIVSLENWREQMTASRLQSLQAADPIICFDGSTTGAGKSTADQQAMRIAGRSVTFVPTHDAAQELARTLNAVDLPSAAYPQLDEKTCLRFDEAAVAQRSGLNIGEALCSDCHLAKQCDFQRLREAARNAPHAVATHARAVTSDFTPAANKPLVFVHEDCIALLRPTVRIAAEKSSTGPWTKDLKAVIDVAREAIYLAESWQDNEKVNFAVALLKSTRELIQYLEDRTLVDQFDQAADLGLDLGTLRKVRQLPLKERIERPARADYLLHRAMQAADVFPPAQATRLATGHACGELAELCVVIDDPFRASSNEQKGAKRQYLQSLVGVWHVELPTEGIVWLENAHGNSQLLSHLANRSISDCTPQGRLAFQHPPLQFADRDVTKSTSAKIVRGLVRGILCRYPEATKVGIITQKCHLPAIEALAQTWKGRIARVEYYRSGKDRASNEWLNCDLLLVIGTPRVPPSAIREGLLQIGNVDAAAGDGVWRSFCWEAKDEAQDIVKVKAHGYSDPAWAAVHANLVRDTLTQAIGRGRGVTDVGIPVVVISNEPLGLPISSEPLPLLNDDVAALYETLLTDIFAKYITLGQLSVSDMTLHATEVTERTIRRHVNLLISLGLLKRKGPRGYIYLSSPPKLINEGVEAL